MEEKKNFYVKNLKDSFKQFNIELQQNLDIRFNQLEQTVNMTNAICMTNAMMKDFQESRFSESASFVTASLVIVKR